jgi:integrase
MTNEDRFHVHLTPLYEDRALGSFQRDELQVMLDAKTVMTLKEVQICFAGLEQCERLVVKFAILAGLRPGEIFGLKMGPPLRDARGHPPACLPGQKSTPRKPVTRFARRRLGAGLLDDIPERKTISRNTGDDGWIFLSETGKTPLSRDNLWRRLTAAGSGWGDFHVMRSTHATLMNEIHNDPKMVADQLGHTLNQNV